MNKCGTMDDPSDQKVAKSYYDFSLGHPGLFATGCLNKIMDRIEGKVRYIIYGLATIVVLLFLCASLSLTLLIIIVNRWKTEQGQLE